MTQPFALRSRLSRLVRDKRGVSSLIVASSAMTIFGAVALATDTGLIYAAKRSAQNAADAGASAAVAGLAFTNATNARAAGLDIVRRNGFAPDEVTTIAVNIPPLSGTRAGDANAAEVIVRKQQGLVAASLFTSTQPVVQGRAVASLRAGNNVCVLALTGPVTAGGSVAVGAPNCVIASNWRGDGSVAVNGDSSTVNAFTLSAGGTCVNCTRSGVTLTEAFREWQIPAENPFRHLDTKALPPSGSLMNCPNSGTWQPFQSNGGRMYRDCQFTGNQTVTMVPGTYYIYNGSLKVPSGILTCPTCTGGAGVTIVLTGSPAQIGDFDINGGSTVRLRAPSNPSDPDYRGVLFWRDGRATGNGSGGNPPVRISGGANIELSGGMYFPNATVSVTGNANANVCSVIVGGTIEFTGSAQVNNCAAVGTTVPRTRMVATFE